MPFQMPWIRYKSTILFPIVVLWTYCAVSSSAAPLPALTLREVLPLQRRVNISSIRMPSLPEITVKQILYGMLEHSVDLDAPNRFVLASPIAQTAIGLSDSTQSSKGLSDLLDQSFGNDPDTTDNGTWVDTYIQFLLDAGASAGSFQQQQSELNAYSQALVDFSKSSAALTAAYFAAFDSVLSLIGIKIPSIPTHTDPLTIRTMEQWAATNATEQQFPKAEWQTYLDRNATLTNATATFKTLDQEIQMTTQAELYKSLCYSQGVYNLSMLIGGTVNSSSALYRPAWSATIIDTSMLNTSDIQQVQQNLSGGLGNSTNSTIETSINSEAPKSTSASLSTTISVGNATSATAHSSAATGSSSAGTSASPSASASASSPSSTAASSTGSASASSAQPTSTGQASTSRRRGVSALEIVANSQKTTKRGVSALEIVANSKKASPDQVKRADSPVASIAPIEASATSSAAGSQPTDPLNGVPDSRPSGNLMLLSLQEGAWSNQRDDYINLARQKNPAVVEKYFGNDNQGLGPIGRHWTHIVLLTTDQPNSTTLQNVQILGRVYDVLPSIKSPGNATSTPGPTFSGSTAVPTSSAASNGTASNSASATSAPGFSTAAVSQASSSSAAGDSASSASTPTSSSPASSSSAASTPAATKKRWF